MADAPSTASTTRKTAQTKRSTAAKKAAATRSANQAAEARKRTVAAEKAAATRAANQAKKPVAKLQHSVEKVQEVAERAVTAQIGAALVARDAVVEAADTLRTSLTSREKAEKELAVRRRRAIAGLEAEFKRFERRGSTARKSVRSDIDARRARVRSEIKSLRSDLTKQVGSVSAPSKLVTARVENLVQTGLTAGQKAATKVQERVASVG
jgi:hypothetical protein